MAWYLRVSWHHDFPEEPVELYSEVGEDGYEVRKVQVFRDGHLERADRDNETKMTGLGEVPIGSVEEIGSQEEFSPEVIGRSEFERMWSLAGPG
ncbi:DUF6881 domain-containing protein [Nonomuraea typhae]|uniref:DUF6881 domain-containing protein n=1 Tax=Nonomuraea typhae TaxID=2603600 RepID=A0ABW7Z2L1_9ACTN